MAFPYTLILVGGALTALSVWLPKGAHPAERPVSRGADLVARFAERAQLLSQLPKPMGGLGPVLSIDSVPEALAERFVPALAAPSILWVDEALTRRAADIEWRVEFPEHSAGGWLQQSNNMGLRSPRPVLGHRPDLRVLLLGGVNVEGRCDYDHSLGAVTEKRLTQALKGRVEVLNAGLDESNPYGHIGTFGELATLRPHWVVWTIEVGYDLAALMPLQRWRHRREFPAPHLDATFETARQDERFGGCLRAELEQAAYFRSNPEDEAVAVRTLARLATELQRRAWLADGEALVVLLPPASIAQPEHYEPLRGHLAKLAGLDPAAAAGTERLGSLLTNALRAGEVPVLDLTASLKVQQRPCFWWSDLSLSERGQRVVGAALAERLQAEL